MNTVSIELTRNQQLVFDKLTCVSTPMTAYHLLESLRDEGLRAPPQIYRALEKLITLGIVHRLDSLNAFVACRHPSCEPHRVSAFAICDQCQQVSEISDPELVKHLRALALEAGLTPRRSNIELQGLCEVCQNETL